MCIRDRDIAASKHSTKNINSYILSIGKILKDNSIYLYDNYEE